ncbi:MAG: SUMF1/EgtB/PvdO family nonheme iron enzyme [Desulfobacterales bacterium]|nr:SUMF1/EgtB/PvdO family nonheme iron enzyme [Desulfobacterales bacterium]
MIQKKTAIRQYEELKTELEICQIGGLFLALYEDEKIPDLIISRLQEELPDFFHFRLHMTDEKILFPLFFSQSFEQLGSHSNIFHVFDIEALSEKSPENFIQSLQHGREGFKSMPYSIVFWIYPQFVKKLFHAAPDFHHWIFSTYDFTDYRKKQEYMYQGLLSFIIMKISHAPIDFHRKKQKIFLRNTDKYLKKLIWQYENWQKLKDKGTSLLLEVIERTNLHDYYVRTLCTDQNGKERPLDDLLDEFIADSEHSFMTLLGDFGTGKSSFSLHYFIIHAKRYLKDRTQRIPLFISLKDYPKKLNLQTFIRNEFSEKFGLSFSSAVFQSLVLQGRFLLFIDGFDEMLSMSDKEETVENFKELTRLSFENLQFMTLSQKAQKNKIFMTCRTHYFFTETQEKDILKADYTVLYRNYATKSQYQVTRINIKEFDHEQIKEYILKSTKNEATANGFIKIINDTYNLSELSTRPLLLDMIVKTMPALRDKQLINAADLYRAYTDDWIKKDDWRSQMMAQGKRRFMWELALKMYQKGGDFSLHYSKLDKPDKAFFKSEQIKEQDGDYFIYEATTCSFLNRDPKGNYRFIHKSFMEYFFAEYFLDCIMKHKPRPKEYSDTNDEVKFFLKMLFVLSKDRLNGLNLSDYDLTGIDLGKANLEETNLRCTNLKKANLKGANFKDTNCYGTLLEGALLDWEYSVTNTLGMRFVYIPPGEFSMGIPEKERNIFDNGSQYTVKLTRGFYMQTTPVTQKQWKELMKYNPSFFKDYGDECPVESVSWHDTQEFIKKLNTFEGKNLYRLPTEIEWEYSCRAGSDWTYYFGDDSEKLVEYAWFDKNSNNRTHQVAQLQPNDWGLYDMYGNVWEWCQDCYRTDPTSDVTDTTDTDIKSDRVSRGGSSYVDNRICQSAYRNCEDPRHRGKNTGFRLVLLL